jgi:hypothetical protein
VGGLKTEYRSELGPAPLTAGLHTRPPLGGEEPGRYIPQNPLQDSRPSRFLVLPRADLFRKITHLIARQFAVVFRHFASSIGEDVGEVGIDWLCTSADIKDASSFLVEVTNSS